MNKAEEEQLLQDASTLLMFANVAAKQQIQHAPLSASYLPESLVQQQQQQQQGLTNTLIKSSSRSPIENLPIAYPNFHNIHSRTPSGSDTVQPTQPSPVTSEHRIPEVKHEVSASKGYYFPVASTDLQLQQQQSLSLQQPQLQLQQQLQQPLDKLPPQASFKSHKRVASAGSSGSFRHSPGPANIALAGGIIESGNNRNSSNNAMIVAAALADAASIPLPLLKKSEENKRVAEIVDSGSSKPEETEVEEDATEDEKETKNADERSTNTTLEESSPLAQNEETDRKQQPSQDHNNEVLPSVLQEVAPTQPHVQTQRESPVPQAAPVATELKSISPPEISTNAIQVALETNQVKTEPSIDTPPAESKIAGTEPQPEPIPPLSSYKVDPDAGTIGCICGIEDDDGFTVQCDICFRWQHCLCMNLMTNEEVPDIYKCYFCDKQKWGKFDPEDCRKQTLARLENERLGDENEPEFKKELKRKHLNSEKGDKKRKTLESKKKRDDDDAKKGELGVGSDPGKTDEKFANETKLSNNLSESNGDNSGNGSSGSNLSSSQIQAQAQAEILSLPNKDNDLLEGGISAESYQGTYYKLRDNDYKTQSIKLAFEELAQMNLKNKSVESLSKVEFRNIRFSKIILPNYEKKLQQMKKKSSTSFNDTSIQVKLYSDNQKQKFNGISRLGVFISKKKQGTGGIIPENTPVIEYLGELSLFQQYIDDKTNQYNLWGVPKPRVLKTELPFAGNESNPGTSVGIISDARFVGNESRFIRNSCPANANCTIKPVFIKDQKIFKFLVVTSKPIIFGPEQSEEELRIEWQWDEKHPIRRMYEKIEEPGTGTNNTPGGGNKQEAMKFDQFSEADKGILISGVDNVLNFAECACGTASPVANSNCVLFKIKKATAYLLRSTRKALSVGSLGLGKSRELLIINKNPKKYISWQERLDERDKIITMDLLCEVDQEETKDGQDGGIAETGETEEKSLNESGNGTADVSMSGTTEEERADTMEIDAEAESTDGSNQSKAIVKTRVPYREQLIAKSRKLKDVTVELNKAASRTNINLCAPIVPELIIKIQKEVSEKIALPVNIVHITNEKFNNEPVIESSMASRATPGAVERKYSSASIAANTAVAGAAVVDLAKTAPSANPTTGITPDSEESSAPLEVKKETDAPKPPVVKKLSFADYKKKMK